MCAQPQMKRLTALASQTRQLAIPRLLLHLALPLGSACHRLPRFRPLRPLPRRQPVQRHHAASCRAAASRDRPERHRCLPGRPHWGEPARRLGLWLLLPGSAARRVRRPYRPAAARRHLAGDDATDVTDVTAAARRHLAGDDVTDVTDVTAAARRHLAGDAPKPPTRLTPAATHPWHTLTSTWHIHGSQEPRQSSPSDQSQPAATLSSSSLHQSLPPPTCIAPRHHLITNYLITASYLHRTPPPPFVQTFPTIFDIGDKSMGYIGICVAAGIVRACPTSSRGCRVTQGPVASHCGANLPHSSYAWARIWQVLKLAFLGTFVDECKKGESPKPPERNLATTSGNGAV